MREQIATDASPSPRGAYSQGVREGQLVFVAGQGPRDPATGRVAEGIEAQTHQTLRNVARILEAGDATMDDVVKVTVHLADLEDFGAFDRAYADHFRRPYPARTTVGSRLPGILLEVDVIAVRPVAHASGPT